MHQNKYFFFVAIYFLIFLSACASNQHLVFFTNSNIGVDISVEPETATPLKFVVGYKRQEGVIDPIGTGYDLHDSTHTDLPVVPEDMDAPVLPTKIGYFVQRGTAAEPHSVLAKMNFGATGGGAGAAAAQWFATGEAAKILAKQPGIAGAIAGDPEVNASVKTLGLKTADKRAGYAALSKIYGDLEKLSKTDSSLKEIKNILSNVDAIADEEIFNNPIKIYKLNGDVLSISFYSPETDKSSSGFNKVLGVKSKIDGTLKAAKEAVIKKDLKDQSGNVLPEDDRKKLVEDIIKFEKDLEEIENTVGTNKDVIQMVEYYFHNVLLTEKRQEEG